MQADCVVFRRWRDSDNVIALFPVLPADLNGWHCVGYAHVGQHSTADYRAVIRQTVPASRKEYASLTAELKRIGYRIKPIRRTSARHRERRHKTARSSRSADTGWRIGQNRPTKSKENYDERQSEVQFGPNRGHAGCS
jgi:hypothetical protein